MRQLPYRSVSLIAALAAVFSAPSFAGEVFSKPLSATGGLNTSCEVDPDGSDSDMYAWDEFVLSEDQTITEVRWLGGYELGAPYGHATDFRVSFFDSNASGFEPKITAFPTHESQETVIATFHTKDVAGESYAGTSGGKVVYAYHYTLKTPVALKKGVKYWFRIVATQVIYPDWGMATGIGGDGVHFRYSTGTTMYQKPPHDLAFSLHSEWVNLGGGLAGTAGVPALSGTTAALSVTSAKASSPAWFVGGLSQVNLPFAGGILIPTPSVIIGANTNATGTATLPFVKPVGLPAGLQISIQAWVFDAAAPQGFSASNGISG